MVFYDQNKNNNIAMLTTKGSKNIWDTNLMNYDYFIFGPESIGLPEEILNLNHDMLTIPMSDNSRSINLANSVSIVSYEFLRQNYKK